MGISIFKIKITRWLAIREFVIDELGKGLLIQGGKGVGKSSFLMALKSFIGFKDDKSKSNQAFIHGDGDEAKVLLELEDGHTLRRVITAEASRTEIKRPDGTKVKKPASWLKDKLGADPFDPIKFYTQNKSEQYNTLLKAIPFILDPAIVVEAFGNKPLIDMEPFDYSQHGVFVIEAIKKSIYEARASQNTIVDQKKKSIKEDRANLPELLKDINYDGFDLNTTSQAQANIQQEIKTYDELQDGITSDTALNDLLEKKITRLRDELSASENEYELRQESINKRVDIKSKTNVEAMRVKAEEIKIQIDGWQNHSKREVLLEGITTKENQLKEEGEKSEALTVLLKRMKKEIPEMLLASMKSPVPGLTFEDGTIKSSGMDIDFLSSGEKLEFAVDVAMLLAGEWKIICIDHFESLDTDSQIEFLAHIRSDKKFEGYQFFIAENTNGPMITEML